MAHTAHATEYEKRQIFPPESLSCQGRYNRPRADKKAVVKKIITLCYLQLGAFLAHEHFNLEYIYFVTALERLALELVIVVLMAPLIPMPSIATFRRGGIRPIAASIGVVASIIARVIWAAIIMVVMPMVGLLPRGAANKEQNDKRFRPGAHYRESFATPHF